MNKYIGVKIVEAKPMNKYEFYISFKGVECKEDNAEGYLVKYPDGYESWCPKKQFEEANKPCDGMTFGHAIESLKKGLKVARKGWNGKGMYLFYIHKDFDGAVMTKEYIMMFAADSEYVPWLASQTDMLAEDWIILK